MEKELSIICVDSCWLLWSELVSSVQLVIVECFIVATSVG